MSIVSKGKKQILNPEECFKLWFELGSLRDVSYQLSQRGIINPITQRPFTIQAIYNAAIMWVLKNPDEAWPYYVQAGNSMSREEWNQWLVKTAVKQIGIYVSRRSFFKWVKRNGFENYAYIYEKILGTFDYSSEVLL